VGQGNYLVITGDNGWSAVYVHVNNDTPGTDDGRGTASWAFPKGIAVGVRVMAGQLVAWRGDSGDAESTGPHLHFELRKGAGWSGVVYNAYPSLLAARRLTAPLPSGPHPVGTLLRSSTGALFVSDGVLKHQVTPGVLAANRLSAASAVPVTAQELLLYRTGAPLAIREGAVVTDPSGAAWRVVGRTRFPVELAPGQPAAPVALPDLAALAVVEPATTPSPGSLVRWDGKTWQVGAGGVLHQLSASAMASWGWTDADASDLVVDVPPATGAPVPLRDATLVNAGGYGAAVVQGGVLRRIWDGRELNAYGYAGLPRLSVPGSVVAGLPFGEIAGTR
jgi:murein DD-endopeptidase MepM/ murein hydrolase activator NlpD